LAAQAEAKSVEAGGSACDKKLEMSTQQQLEVSLTHSLRALILFIYLFILF
jgi:hypothetical protein